MSFGDHGTEKQSWLENSKMICCLEDTGTKIRWTLSFFCDDLQNISILQQFKANETAKFHFKEKGKKKVPCPAEYLNDGLSWISPESRTNTGETWMTTTTLLVL